MDTCKAEFLLAGCVSGGCRYLLIYYFSSKSTYQWRNVRVFLRVLLHQTRACGLGQAEKCTIQCMAGGKAHKNRSFDNLRRAAAAILDSLWQITIILKHENGRLNNATAAAAIFPSTFCAFASRQRALIVKWPKHSGLAGLSIILSIFHFDGSCTLSFGVCVRSLFAIFATSIKMRICWSWAKHCPFNIMLQPEQT